MKENRINTISNAPKKTVYLDVILADGTFCRQVPYQYCPLFPFDERKAKKNVLQSYPSLANKKIKIKVSNNRIINN